MKRFGPKPRRQRKTDDPEWQRFFNEDQKEAAQRQAVLEMPLADAGLAIRTINTLEGKDILTVKALASKTREFLLAIDNFGEQTLAEVTKVVDDLGVSHPDWSPVKTPRPAGNSSARKSRPSS